MIRVNAWEATYDIVELDDTEIAITDVHLDVDTIPMDMYCYDLKHAEGNSDAYEIVKSAEEDWCGTVIAEKLIPMSEGFYSVVDKFNYKKSYVTLNEFISEEMI